MPRLYILAGCNGSGKTTASYTLLPELFNCREFVNSDEFAKSLSPFDPSAASVTASRYMLTKINYLLDRYEDFCIETTLATRSLLGIIQKAKEMGYTVTLFYFWLNSPNLAISRVQARVKAGGHLITDDVVRRRYVMGLLYFFTVYKDVCDRWTLADNSESPFTVVAEGFAGVVTVNEPDKYNKIWNLVHNND